mgnify:CR=1 FL=1
MKRLMEDAKRRNDKATTPQWQEFKWGKIHRARVIKWPSSGHPLLHNDGYSNGERYTGKGDKEAEFWPAILGSMKGKLQKDEAQEAERGSKRRPDGKT